jgi:cytochrome b involved in lipid metabolism
MYRMVCRRGSSNTPINILNRRDVVIGSVSIQLLVQPPYRFVVAPSIVSSAVASTTRMQSSYSKVAFVEQHNYSYEGYSSRWNNRWKTSVVETAAVLVGATTLISAGAAFDSVLSQQTLCEASVASKQSSGDIASTNEISSNLTPSSVAKEDFEAIVESHSEDDLPIYTADDVAENDGTNGKPIWMSYGGIVYDVTNFVPNHPGGSDKIIQAAGSAVEPFWYLYRQHFNSDLPMRLMEHMAVGTLRYEDQKDIDEQMLVLELDDPYAREPVRNRLLRVHSDAPMNAEVPTQILSEHYITPNDLFYIRNHHPVPYFTEQQIHDFQLKVDLSGYNGDLGVVSFTLDQLKQMPKTELIVTLQCSGNRRGGYNAYQRTSGTPWGMNLLLETVFF